MTAPTDDLPPMLAARLAAENALGRGVAAAIVYALVAHCLAAHYDDRVELSAAQGASLVADWLARRKESLPGSQRRRLSEISAEVAGEIASSLSREAGLYAAHELMESLDPRYDSPFGRAVMAQCAAAVGDSTDAG